MKGEKKSPDSEDGAKNKLYEKLALISIILGMMCLVVKDKEGYQNFAIAALLFSDIQLQNEIRRIKKLK